MHQHSGQERGDSFQKYCKQLLHPILAHRIALCVFALLASAFLHEVLFSGKSLSAFDIILAQPGWSTEAPTQKAHQNILWDSPTAHYPERKLNWTLLRQGHKPAYNPFIFSGTESLWLGVGSFVTSIPQLFLTVPSAIDWSTWFRLLLCGFFMYLLLITLRVPRAVAIFGGILWTYNFHQIVWLQFPQHLATQIWIPLIFLLNLKLLDRPASIANWVGVFVVNILFYTSGYIQIVLYTYLLVGVSNTLYLLIDRNRLFMDKLKIWVTVHGGYLLLLAVLWPTVLQEWTVITQGLRGEQAFRAGTMEFGFSIKEILNGLKQLLPDFGDFMRFYSPRYLGGLWGKPYNHAFFPNIIEGASYMGFLMMVFVPFSLTRIRYKNDGRLIIVLLLSLFLVIGFNHHNQLIVNLINLIPVGGFGGYGRSITLIVFLLSILSAMGFAAFLELMDKRQFMIPLLVLVILLGLPVILKASGLIVSLTFTLYPYLVAGAFVLCLLTLIYFNKTRWMATGVIVIVIVDLFLATYGFNTKLDNDRIFPRTPILNSILSDPEDFRVAVFSKTPGYRSNVLTYYGIPTVEGYATTAPRTYLQFMRTLFDGEKVYLNGLLELGEPNLQALRLLNVKYLITDFQMDNAHLVSQERSNGHYLYRMTNHLPRAYCASDVVAYQNEAQVLSNIRELMRSHDRPIGVTSDTMSTKTVSPNCSIKHVTALLDGVTFTVDGADKSIVSIPYNYSENWRGTIDGEPLELIRANYSFLAAEVPAGEYRIEIRHRDWKITVAAVLQISFGFGLLFFVFYYRKITTCMRVGYSFIALVFILVNTASVPGILNDTLVEKVIAQSAPANVRPR